MNVSVGWFGFTVVCVGFICLKTGVLVCVGLSCLRVLRLYCFFYVWFVDWVACFTGGFWLVVCFVGFVGFVVGTLVWLILRRCFGYVAF